MNDGSRSSKQITLEGVKVGEHTAEAANKDLDESSSSSSSSLSLSQPQSATVTAAIATRSQSALDKEEPWLKAVAYGRNYFYALGGTTKRVPEIINPTAASSASQEAGTTTTTATAVPQYEWSIPPWLLQNINKSSSSRSHGSAGGGSGSNSSKFIYGLRNNSSSNNQRNASFNNNTATAAKLQEVDPQMVIDASIQQAVATAQSTVFLTKGGKVYQTGTLHGFVTTSPTALTIPLPIPAVELAAGRHFCLARMQGGIAVCSWGAGHFGQLGIGPVPGVDQQQQPVTFTSRPVLMERLLPRVIGSPVRHIAAGDWHGLALTESGMVWAWGSNRSQQCGRKVKSQTSEETPTLVVPTPVPLEVEMLQIAAGRSHSLAISKVEQQVYSWGCSMHGQCGHAIRRTPQPPRLIESMRDLTISKIKAAGNHSLALTMGGRLFAWGQQTEGQLGLGPAYSAQAKPRLVSELDFVAIVASQEYKRSQQQQQVGDTASSKPPPLYSESPLRSIPRIVDIFAGPSYSVAISSSGHAYVFGSNDAGNLGLPTPSDLPMQDNGQPAEGTTSSNTSGSTSPNSNAESPPRQPPPRRKGTPEVHVQSFDSRHNVLLPTRIDALVEQGMRIRTAACGPNHLWFIGHNIAGSNGEEGAPAVTLPVGRTLYEVQYGKSLTTTGEEKWSKPPSIQQQFTRATNGQDGDLSSLLVASLGPNHQLSPEGWSSLADGSPQAMTTFSFDNASSELAPQHHATIPEGEPLNVLSAARSFPPSSGDTAGGSEGRQSFSAPVSPSRAPPSRVSPQGPRAVMSRLNKLRKRLGNRRFSDHSNTDSSIKQDPGVARSSQQPQSQASLRRMKRNSL